jgi:predicted pyridoxine 5'-phosphate oxidase superfamily flavin-nucleotide-binding protein
MAASALASPWHPGELEMQRRVGSVERMAAVGRQVLRDHLIEQHRQFYPLLPFIVVGAVDPQGDAWATLRTGRPGFLSTPDMHTLRLGAPRDAQDPAERGMEEGDAVGLLGIDLQTRRRNRLNGIVHRIGGEAFEVTVRQSYGNCPRYIQQRQFSFVRDGAGSGAGPRVMDRLDSQARNIIAVADTFFVASYFIDEDGERQVDVSHRGGRSGFVRVGEDGALTIPDFSGNQFFNTLGNLAANPKSGLLFVDFASGDMLQVTGDAEILPDSLELAAFEGAERLWRFTPRRIVHRKDALPLRWAFQEQGWSPFALQTGDWNEAAARLEAMSPV